MLIANPEWYDEMVQECRAIATETLYRSQMELIEGKHRIGEEICSNANFAKMPGSKHAKLQQLFKDIGIGRSDGYACVAFYQKFPKLSDASERFKEQKAISWNRIVHTYLPEGKEKEHEECKHKNIIRICNDCKKRIK